MTWESTTENWYRTNLFVMTLAAEVEGRIAELCEAGSTRHPLFRDSRHGADEDGVQHPSCAGALVQGTKLREGAGGEKGEREARNTMFSQQGGEKNKTQVCRREQGKRFQDADAVLWVIIPLKERYCLATSFVTWCTEKLLQLYTTRKEQMPTKEAEQSDKSRRNCVVTVLQGFADPFFSKAFILQKDFGASTRTCPQSSRVTPCQIP